jgi:hypothetical protein
MGPAHHLRIALETGYLSDFSIQCQNQTFPVHKMILGITSNKIKVLNRSCMKLDDSKPEIVQALIEFIYFGEVSVLETEMPELLKLGKMLVIPAFEDYMGDSKEVFEGQDAKLTLDRDVTGLNDDIKDNSSLRFDSLLELQAKNNLSFHPKLTSTGRKKKIEKKTKLSKDIMEKKLKSRGRRPKIQQLDDSRCFSKTNLSHDLEESSSSLRGNLPILIEFGSTSEPTMTEIFQHDSTTPTFGFSGDENDRSQTELKCDICAKMLPGPISLKCHKREVHPGPLQCTMCNKPFGAKLYLKRHIKRNSCKPRTSHALKDHAKHKDCHICGQVFDTFSEKIRHTDQAHPGTRAFRCEFCGKTNVNNMHLMRHQRYHCKVKIPRRDSINRSKGAGGEGSHSEIDHVEL